MNNGIIVPNYVFKVNLPQLCVDCFGCKALLPCGAVVG